MPNHWHTVISLGAAGAISDFIQWVTLTHTQRYHAYNGTTGYGHVYHSGYKSSPVHSDDHFHTVCGYVESNALRANLIKPADDHC